MPASQTRSARDSKYKQLAEMLRIKVSNGELAPGGKLPSFAELCSQYDVSRGTVEKVYSLLERDGLIAREQGRGVFVAIPISRQKRAVIGFVGGGFAETGVSQFWAHLVAGIHKAAGEHNVQLLLVNKNADPKIWSNVDGVLLSENEEDIPGQLKQIPDGLPCVSLLVPGHNISCVLSDNAQGTFQATRHLLSLGHRRIGMLVSNRNQTIENRLFGYRRALGDHQIEPLLSWVRLLNPGIGNADSKAEFFEEGRRTVTEWLRTDWMKTSCTALLVQNDPAAVGAIMALQAAGLRVPEDVSVVGFDGVEKYDYMSPSLTTVEVPVEQIGAMGVATLVKLIEREIYQPVTHVLPSKLRIRGSTGPCSLP